MLIEELIYPNGKYENNIFIMFHNKERNLPNLSSIDLWIDLQKNGETADGVAIVEGDKLLVVAPTGSDSALRWSNAPVNGGGTMTNVRDIAINDWNGRSNAKAQIQHNECQGSDTAVGFCATYTRTNINGIGVKSGDWWLPSLGEMIMIFANLSRINEALKVIENATVIDKGWYWTSTESTVYEAWGMNLAKANIVNDTTSKYSDLNNARAVTTFIL